MPEYLSPGVYVEEIPSAVKPIAGVSTSTACFIGVVPDLIQVPAENSKYDPTGKSTDPASKNPFVLQDFKFYSGDERKARVLALDAGQKALQSNTDPAQAKKLALAVRQAEIEKTQAEWPAQDKVPVLCTNLTDFTKRFGGFSVDGLGAKSSDFFASTGTPTGGLQNQLAHAVFGFFDNGGSRCYVMRFKTVADIKDPANLEALEGVDEISLVAAPGINDKDVQQNIIDHCTKMNRFAILDPPDLEETAVLSEDTIKLANNSDHAALYFPRIRVFDMAAQLTRPEIGNPDLAEEVNNGEVWVGPSGHIAGVYARVDDQRGVHKAPANEVIRGALDVEFQISKGIQDGLNPYGVNCIRNINSNITVWGARTVGGDANTDLKYINVRRTLIFLEKSIDEGTQWVVFEPNDLSLWAKITRNVGAFLTTVWRDGALFGATPQEAFYVKCDAETNPPEERDLGKVTTEIGVSIVRPAEFVIFRVSQWAGPTAQ